MTIRILTGGVAKDEAEQALRALGLPGLEVRRSSDLEAAMKLRSGGAEYYIGTCHTGAGASLGVLVGLLGSACCHTFGRGLPEPAEVERLLGAGVRAFGVSMDRMDEVLPVLGRALAARASRDGSR
jgi:hypothetical protein